MNDIDTYINETGNGVEDSARFWMNIWNLKNTEEFKTLIDMERLNKFRETNDVLMKYVNIHTLPFDWECEFLLKDKLDYGNLVNFFDEYNFDGNTPSRILEFIENDDTNRTNI